tara:strand:- start:1414 stop:2340 length:927 start_codon:yes stop_codon:yes gene_type:complete
MINRKIKFLLFGGNRLKEDMPTTYLIDYFKKKKIKFLLITENIHLNKETNSKKKFKFHLNKKDYILLKKFHKKKVLKLIDNNTYGLSLLSVWKFPEEIIKKFNGRLFNYHPSDLPSSRGAANITWKILNENKKYISLNFHDVEKEFDTGKIVSTKKITLSKSFIPYDYYKSILKTEKFFLIDFIKKILNDKKMSKKKQKGESFYWPRLNADVDGKINWSWDCKSIFLFIRAFSHPFSGAFTFIGKRKIRIFNAKYLSKKRFHPFQNGLVFRENNKKIFIAHQTGYLEILKKDLKYEKKFKSFIGKRLV